MHSTKFSPERMGVQKPGFFTKRRVATRRLGKKPGGFFVGVRPKL